MPGEQGVDVAEVLVRRRIAGIQADRLLELGARLGVLAVAGVDRGEIVVRLGELGIVLDERLQDRLRLGGAARVGQENRFQEAHLRVLGLCGEDALGTLEGSGGLAGTMETRDLRQVFGGRAPAGDESAPHSSRPMSEDPGRIVGSSARRRRAHVDHARGAAILNRL